MHRKVYKEYPDVQRFRVPYLRALKAMAWADYEFDVIAFLFREWGFFFPDEECAPDEYDMMYSKFRYFHHEAVRRSGGGLDFSDGEVRNEGLSPFYEWLRLNKKRVKVEPQELPYEQQVMQQVMTDIHFAPIRRAVCILAWKMTLDEGKGKLGKAMKRESKRCTPEFIGDMLQTDPRSPTTLWGREHVRLFLHFFWDLSEMAQRHWQLYANFQHIGDNPHMTYLQPIFENADRTMVSWHDGPTLDLDDDEVLKEVMAVQRKIMLNSAEELSLRASRELTRSLATKSKIAYEKRMTPEAPKENPLEDIELLIKQTHADQEMAFANIAEIDGDVSDPRDTSFGKDEYLDQE
jgi:NACalpha-BTF3-like transcription factor